MSSDYATKQAVQQLLQQGRHLATRRALLGKGVNVMGMAAMASLLGGTMGKALGTDEKPINGAMGPHFTTKAKRVIYLHMVGGPSQMDLFDYKPQMNEWYDKDLPESIINGQRLTTMTSGQKRFPIAPSKYTFTQRGECGMWMNDLLPHLGTVADDICFMRSMHTEAINHEPAICALQTGNQVTGRPCIGSSASYGVGPLNANLPT
jgi:hypothetical protein